MENPKSEIRNPNENKDSNVLQELSKRVGELGVAMERAQIDKYVSMLQKPWQFFWFSFLNGIFSGVGVAIGMTIVFAIVIYILTVFLRQMIDVPVVGMYVAKFISIVNVYLKEGAKIR
ncbi:MAG: DUF5665 domain-containing protein [Candidatus Saganbacteria bacterium]|nr:DUF5665 domain-containing protein [Candidatus Saganbacteria bacterium]